MSVIEVRRERDIVLIPSLSNGTVEEGDERQVSAPMDLDEGKINMDCGRDRGWGWVLDDEDGREVGLTILDATALELGFRCGSTAGVINLDEVGVLPVVEDRSDGCVGDEDLGRPVTPVEVSGSEGKTGGRPVPGSSLFRLSLSLSEWLDPPHKSTRSCTELCLRFGFELTSDLFCLLLLNSFRVPNPPSGSSGPSSLLTDPLDGFRGSRPFGITRLRGLRLSDKPFPFAVASPFVSGRRELLLFPGLIG